MHRYPANLYHRKTAPFDKTEFDALYAQSIQNPAGFWAEQSKKLAWFQPWEQVFEGSFEKGDISWFRGGKLNACYNCVDRHVEKHGDETALLWEGNTPGESSSLSYSDLYLAVCQLANALKSRGVTKGDSVCIYMPMIMEAAIAMLACARIGAVHSVVFGGFSADALANRITDADCKCIITADETERGIKTIPLKKNVDEALKHCRNVHTVIVVNQYQKSTETWNDDRDHDYHTLVSQQSTCCPCEEMDAEDPLFILYTSGSTGKPKGILHTTAGYLLYSMVSFQTVFDYQPGEVYWCTADIGWITGHSYVVYGPLANRATSVIFAGVPNYPDMSRYWQIVDKYQVNIFYTAPTALRTLMAAGDEPVKSTWRTSLRCLGSVGEPINPEVWEWYFHVIGNGHCPIMDTWWQTETGGFLITPIAGITNLKPGSATLPFFGIQPTLVEGELYIEASWPGQMRSIYNDHQRFITTYLSQVKNKYCTGDGAHQDDDGYYWLTGRVDDVIKVSGHRVGSAEVESALVDDHRVAEAAVVSIPHAIKGESIYAFVILKQNQIPTDALKSALKDQIKKEIGAFAVPEHIQFANDLPKTRSGKIMRRLLRKIANGDDDLGDISTLADPDIIHTLIQNKL
ncbi:MAG: acetate--CoA ligase [Gammaproteobacteria bacterium]|nr:acetate--CoA ligase [Gammaproteobacteria bacterium]